MTIDTAFITRLKFLNKEGLMQDLGYCIARDRLDLVEACSPWHSPLGEAVEQAGGSIFRMGLHNGFDLATRAGLVKALAALRKMRPRYLHVSPPCYPWTSVNHTNQKDPNQIRKLQEKQSHGRLILRNCLKLIQVLRQELDGQSGMGPDCQEAHAGGEQPLRTSSWKEKSMLRLCGERFRCDGCQFGLENRKGLPIQKPWGWFSSLSVVKEALNRVCGQGHSYGACQCHWA